MTAAIIRALLLLAVVAGLEILCLTGRIGAITMQPPHQMMVDLWHLLASGALNKSIGHTLANALTAFLLAVTAGVTSATLLQPRKGLRRTLEPLFSTYYAIPILAFYPLLVVALGLGDAPQIIVGFMQAVVAVIVSTLNGLDRVPQVFRKTARVQRLGTVATAWRITLPCAWPHVLTGAKLAVAYALIGVIASEFIMARDGLGYEIADAYNNFDNARMYPLIIVVLAVAMTVNFALFRWEKALQARRGLT
jgi:NitT/TauT family transport system permease protein